jgi:hypothetical protein
MPLFFLISGFFGRMMLEKYGLAGYLRRRWSRIGIVLVVSMFTLGPLYVATRDLTSSMPGRGPGGPGPGGPPGGPGAMLEPPPGFVPPPFRRFDVDGDGSLSEAEWREARKAMAGNGGPGGPPGFRPPGGGPPGFGPGQEGLASRIFGPAARYVQLNHLWFLWYLLVFITVTPFLAGAIGWVVDRSGQANRPIGARVFRWGLAPAVLAVAATPALLGISSPFGWFLGLAPAIFRAFPDFLWHYDADMLFYAVFFWMGWWLHRDRGSLDAVSRAWVPNGVVGLVAFAAALTIEARWGGGQPAGLAKMAAYGIYCLGSASMCFAFLGFFQRYLDVPSRSWRYLADTALWIYLIHQPLVLVGLAATRSLNLPWWARVALVSGFSVAAALGLYELLIRPTALVRLFGPSASRRVVKDPPPTPVAEAVSAGVS